MYKIFTIGFFSILAFAAIYFLFLFSYTIENDKKSVENALIERINETEKVKKYLSVKEFSQIEKSNSFVAVFQLSNDEFLRHDTYVGMAILTRGITGKLKITSSSYGIKDVFYEKVETNKGKFIVFGGMNKNEGVKELIVTFKTVKNPFTMPLSKGGFFTSSKKVSNTFKENQYPEITFK